MMAMNAIITRRTIVRVRPFVLQQRHGKRALCCAAANQDTKWKTRHSSTPASTPDDAVASKLVEEKIWEQQPKRTIFPWRHEPEPLARLVDPTIQGGVLGPGLRPLPWWIRALFMQVAGIHLGVPWYNVLTTSEWKQELADASGFAFSQAVAGVLSNTYKVSFQEIVSEEGGIDFITVTDEVNEDQDANSAEAPPVNETENKPREAEEEEEDEEEDIVTPEIEDMMEEKLRKLYEACHEFGKDQMRIQLQTEPIHCELVSLLFIPYLTRQAVHDSPSLRHAYRNILRSMQENSIDENGNRKSIPSLFQEGMRLFEEFFDSRAQIDRARQTATMESTVIAQVLIDCDEVFSVIDVATGMLIQGHGEKQRVSHVVRLEVVVKEVLPLDEDGKSSMHVGSWQIVDWDDLEGGNIWYK